MKFLSLFLVLADMVYHVCILPLFLYLSDYRTAEKYYQAVYEDVHVITHFNLIALLLVLMN